MLGHDDVGIHAETVFLPSPFQGCFEAIARGGFCKKGLTPVARKRNEVMVALTIAAFEMGRHPEVRLAAEPTSRKSRDVGHPILGQMGATRQMWATRLLRFALCTTRDKRGFVFQHRCC